MDMTYSLDFRRRVMKIKEKETLSFAKVSKKFGIAISSLQRWSHNMEPKLTRHKPSIKIDMTLLKQDVELYPDAYLYERAKRLGVSRNGIYWALKRLKVTYKKNSAASQSGSRKAHYVLPTHPGTQSK